MLNSIGFLFFFVLVIKVVLLFGSRTNGKYLNIISLFIITSFIYVSDAIRFLIFFFMTFIIVLLSFKRFKIFYPVGIYILFLIYSAFTLFYSQSLHYGIFMFIKLMIPIVFMLCGYVLVFTKERFLKLLLISRKYFVLLSLLSCAPFAVLGAKFPLLASWSAGNTYNFVILLSIPISLYFLFKQKKFLFESLIMTMPFFSLIRRACIGASVLVLFISFYFKKGLQSIVPIFISCLFLLVLILNVPQLKNRFFGGDKGDVSELSTSELLSSENVSSSGRDFMWNWVLNKFYIGNEITGCGLGTMKAYLRNNAKGETEHFEMLHNDHLHLLIETGIIGLIIFLAFYVIVLYESFIGMINKHNHYLVRISAFCSLCMVSSTLFSMYFGNIFSMLYPNSIALLFSGIFFKLKSCEKNLI